MGMGYAGTPAGGGGEKGGSGLSRLVAENHNKRLLW